MGKFDAQLERIKRKAPLARAADPELRAFGAKRHRYRWGAPATEEVVSAYEARLGASLPEDYRAFVLKVANGQPGEGGKGLAAAAGPYCGVSPLRPDDLMEETLPDLRAPCVLRPDMTMAEGEALEETLSFKDDLLGPYQLHGFLPVADQGCACWSGLILNGPWRGRVVNVDEGGGLPFFAYEENFLDWYERWLDEVISGQQTQELCAPFGEVMGGSEDRLLEIWRMAPDDQTRAKAFYGLRDKPRLSAQALDALLVEGPPGDPFLPGKVSLACKFAPHRAAPFASNPSPEIRSRVLSGLNQIPDRADYEPLFRAGLSDPEREVVSSALEGMKASKPDAALLPLYKAILDRFPEKGDDGLHRALWGVLKPLGLTLDKLRVMSEAQIKARAQPWWFWRRWF